MGGKRSVRHHFCSVLCPMPRCWPAWRRRRQAYNGAPRAYLDLLRLLRPGPIRRKPPSLHTLPHPGAAPAVGGGSRAVRGGHRHHSGGRLVPGPLPDGGQRAGRLVRHGADGPHRVARDRLGPVLAWALWALSMGAGSPLRSGMMLMRTASGQATAEDTTASSPSPEGRAFRARRRPVEQLRGCSRGSLPRGGRRRRAEPRPAGP
jgi:hypothetical protein